ncbi:hypothetical protein VTN31DRAFT_4905 [Thermomyces dupontii]|uniref:uncharacterized protein n=1 Tax=Talaromyces thermophilus TaxID=28565 RepID=UPI003743340C
MDPAVRRVILSSHRQWDDWFSGVWYFATIHEIWKYVDPNVEDPPALVEPAPPTPGDIRPGAVRRSQLSEGEREDLQQRVFEYEFQHRDWADKAQAMKQLHQRICSTVTAQTLKRFMSITSDPGTNNARNVHLLLRALKDEFAPSSSVYKYDLSRQYEALKQGPRGQDLVAWVDKWREIKRKLDDAGMSQSALIVSDFIDANYRVNHSFTATRSLDALEGRTSWEQLSLDFRRYYQHMSALHNARNSAFAAKLGGKGTSYTEANTPDSQQRQDSNQQQRQSSTPRRGLRGCVCGAKHRFINCPYLVPSKRLPGWKEAPDVRRRVDDAMRNPETKALVENILAKNGVLQQPHNSPTLPGPSHTQQPDPPGHSDQPSVSFTFATLSSFHTSAPSEDHPLYRCLIADSGADTHVFNETFRDRLTNIRKAGPHQFVAHGDSLSPIVAFGDGYLRCEDGSMIILRDVAYVPNFQSSLVSLLRAAKAGCRVTLTSRGLDLYLPNGVKATSAVLTDNGFVLERFSTVPETSPDSGNFSFAARSSTQPSCSSASTELWRRRLGWPSFEAISHLPQNIQGAEITDLDHRPTKGDPVPLEEAYELANPRRQISRRPPTRPPEYPFEYVWFDIVIETLTGFDGTTCILHFYCPFTKLHVVERLDRKSQVSDRVRDFVAYVERQFGTSVRELHSDNEQSLDNDFRAWASRTGRRLVTSAEYSPEQNGTIERAGRTLGETQRFLRIDAKLPENLYPETWTAAAYLRNRTPTRALGWRTPWEALFDWMRAEGKTRSVWTKPVVGHLRAYGSRAYVLDHKVPKGRKSMARAHIGYLVGYESTNIFRVWVPI